MGHLIEDILRLSHLTRKEMACEKVDLAELASGIISDLRKVYPDRDVTFTAPDSTLVEGDPMLITALMQNLIENAWKFSSPRDHAHIEFAAKEQDGETIYSLGDDGVGFDMAYASKLFEPFQRLHNNDEFPGTGIGLATVQRVINRHNGRIWAESEVGKGSVFYFTL
jgi:light-regulated signal transduction histidine kinase (bacteriophytochrome)